MSGVEHDVKLRTVQLRSLLRHDRGLSQTRLFQQKLTWERARKSLHDEKQPGLSRPETHRSNGLRSDQMCRTRF